MKNDPQPGYQGDGGVGQRQGVCGDTERKRRSYAGNEAKAHQIVDHHADNEFAVGAVDRADKPER